MKRKCVFFFLSFLWVEKSFIPAWIRREIANEEIVAYFDLNRITHILEHRRLQKVSTPADNVQNRRRLESIMYLHLAAGMEEKNPLVYHAAVQSYRQTSLFNQDF